jgi:hypothetical protein
MYGRFIDWLYTYGARPKDGLRTGFDRFSPRIWQGTGPIAKAAHPFADRDARADDALEREASLSSALRVGSAERWAQYRRVNRPTAFKRDKTNS